MLNLFPFLTTQGEVAPAGTVQVSNMAANVVSVRPDALEMSNVQVDAVIDVWNDDQLVLSNVQIDVIIQGYPSYPFSINIQQSGLVDPIPEPPSIQC